MPDPQWTLDEAIEAQMQMAADDLELARAALDERRFVDAGKDASAAAAELGAAAAFQSIKDGVVDG